MGKALDLEGIVPQDQEDSEIEKFWTLMAKISGVSAEPPPYAEACKILSLNPAEPRWTHGYAAGDIPENGLVLKPWQVQGAAWMVLQELGPLRAYLLGDACGIGKTIQVLCAISFAAKEIQAKIEAGKVRDARPTLILAPSNCVEVWTDEMTKYFPNIRVRRYYEAPDKVPPHLASLTLKPKVKDLKAYIEKECAGDNIKTPWTVIVSSYETMTSRCFVEVKTKTSGEEGELLWDQLILPPLPLHTYPEANLTTETIDLIDEEAEPVEMQNREFRCLIAGLFARVVADEGHKIKNPQTTFSRLIAGLQCPILGILTATPFMNKVIDGLGYLTLIWRDEMDLHESEALYGDVHEWFSNEDFVPEHTPAYQDGGVYDFAKYRQRFWRLKPTTFKAITQQDGNQALYLIRQVLSSLIPLIMLRRTQVGSIDPNP